MGFSWFWDRVSEKWVTSNVAACLFGLATLLICLLTSYWLGAIEIREIGTAGSIFYGLASIFSVLSIPFLWGGMRKYQEMINRRQADKLKAIRIAMLMGGWYTAIIYFLFVYLPTRNSTSENGG